MKPGSILLLNLFLAIGWVALQMEPAASDFWIGFIVSFILLALIHREYGARTLASCGFVIFLIWSIVKSSLQVAGLILSPHAKLDQGIVAIPLDVTSDFEVAILATSITLTPGTRSRTSSTHSGVKRPCTEQWPSHRIIRAPRSCSTVRPPLGRRGL